jgi:RNA recognition motif-containing protein
LFQKYGEVKSVSLITDKYSGESKGFAFVEMASAEDAEKALAENGNEFMGRALNVSEARPPKQFDRGGRGGGGRGGYRGGSSPYGKKRRY